MSALTKEEIAFQKEVRAFFAEKLTPEIRHAGSHLTSVYADPKIARPWQKIMAAQGWAAPSWPVEYGGCDWTPMQHLIFARERIAAGAPPLSPMGVNMVANVIIRFGTPEQKTYFLPRTLNGDIFWCQGYSEPGAGSDLAALQMSAEDAGDHFVCNGSKIWTTHAHAADWVFCLVRTARESTPQQGITFILIDMKSPGVEVRPLIMLSGEHIQNEIFFTNVRVPKENVLGQVGMGWHVAKSLLEFERGGSVGSPGLQVMLANITANARKTPMGDGKMLIDDPDFAAKLADAKIRVTTFEALELRLLGGERRNAAASPSMKKVLVTELSQHLTELALEVAAVAGNRFQPHATHPGGPIPGYKPPSDGYVAGEPWQSIAPLKYLNDRAGTIYAGSSEVQRNIMTKMVLGL